MKQLTLLLLALISLSSNAKETETFHLQLTFDQLESQDFEYIAVTGLDEQFNEYLGPKEQYPVVFIDDIGFVDLPIKGKFRYWNLTVELKDSTTGTKRRIIGLNSLGRSILGIPGDTLNIHIQTEPIKNSPAILATPSLSGSRVPFYKYQLDIVPLEQLQKSFNKKLLGTDPLSQKDEFWTMLINHIDEARSLVRHESQKWRLSEDIVQILEADHLSFVVDRSLSLLAREYRGNTDQSVINEFHSLLNQPPIQSWVSNIPDKILAQSAKFSTSVVSYYSHLSTAENSNPRTPFNPSNHFAVNTDTLFQHLSKLPFPRLRSKSIWLWFKSYFHTNGIDLAKHQKEIEKMVDKPFRSAFLNYQINRDYELFDEFGVKRKISDFEGKVLIFDLWFNGCRGCMLMKEPLEDAHRLLSDNDDLLFISLNVDRTTERWKRGLASGQYPTENSLNLYIGNLGLHHPLIDDLNVTSFPTLLVFNKTGELIWEKVPDPRKSIKNFVGYIHSILEK